MLQRISAREIRAIILNEIKRINDQKRRIDEEKKYKKIADCLLEHTVSSAADDINDMDAAAVWDIMVSGDPAQADPFLKSVGTATKWAGDALKKVAADADGLKSKAEEIWGAGDAGKKTFVDRVGKLVTKLGAATGFSKPEMPAFEGDDATAVADALDEPGEINIDIGADWGGDTPNFEKYVDEAPDPKEEKKTKGSKNDNLRRAGNLVLERWHRLAGLTEISKDERFPFVGSAKVMPGAPNLGSKGSIDVGAIKGVAKKFLTKGKGNPGDDVNVKTNTNLSNGKMKPTQKNVKAAKSILFALGDIGEDMGGAFADDDGNIIDGHHRWSGQYLRTGGAIKHTGVNIITKPPGMDVPTFLTMLTVVGNALGRPTKLK